MAGVADAAVETAALGGRLLGVLLVMMAMMMVVVMVPTLFLQN